MVKQTLSLIHIQANSIVSLSKRDSSAERISLTFTSRLESEFFKGSGKYRTQDFNIFSKEKGIEP